MYLATLPKTSGWLISIDSAGEWTGICEVEYKGRVRLKREHYQEVEHKSRRKFSEPLQLVDLEEKHFVSRHSQPRNGAEFPTRKIPRWEPSYWEFRKDLDVYLFPIPEFEKFDAPEFVLKDIQGLDFTAIRYSKTNELFNSGLTIAEFYHRAKVDQAQVYNIGLDPFFDDGRFVIEDYEVSRYEDMSDARALRSVANIIEDKAIAYQGELYMYERFEIHRDQLVASSHKESKTLNPTRLLGVINKVWDIEGEHLKPMKVYDLIMLAWDEEDDRYDVRSFIEYIDNTGIAYMLDYGVERKKDYNVLRTSFREPCQRARELRTTSLLSVD